MSIQLLQGNRAAALGALAAGCRFFAGYPITPSSEIAEIMSRELPKVGGKFIQMEDEIASIAAVIGGSVGGLKSMTATSGPGFSLMQENIGYAAVAEIPCVVINVMRAGPSTGLPTSPAQGDVMQARWGTHGDHPIIALAPGSVREAFDLTVKAFNFAEKYRTPVLVLMDEVIGHMRERVDLPDPEAVEIDNREMPTVPPEWYEPFGNPPSDVPPLAPFGEGYRYHITGLLHDSRGFPTERLDEIQPWVE
ncbi:MAG: 2-oxoacid:acceptor oxidoreductase subunit alpha, partial [Anaerolineae bacterium]